MYNIYLKNAKRKPPMSIRRNPTWMSWSKVHVVRIRRNINVNGAPKRSISQASRYCATNELAIHRKVQNIK